LAAFARSNLDIPKALAKGISLYLMMSIGLRDGRNRLHAQQAAGGRAGLALSFLGPRSAFWLLPTLGGAGPHGRWRDDQLSGATAEVMLLAIASTEHADAFIARLAPLLEGHHLLPSGDVEVVRGRTCD
jgi:hypothetical protein